MLFAPLTFAPSPLRTTATTLPQLNRCTDHGTGLKVGLCSEDGREQWMLRLTDGRMCDASSRPSGPCLIEQRLLPKFLIGCKVECRVDMARRSLQFLISRPPSNTTSASPLHMATVHHISIACTHLASALYPFFSNPRVSTAGCPSPLTPTPNTLTRSPPRPHICPHALNLTPNALARPVQRPHNHHRPHPHPHALTSLWPSPSPVVGMEDKCIATPVFMAGASAYPSHARSARAAPSVPPHTVLSLCEALCVHFARSCIV